MNKQRVLYLDVMRIAAIFCVVVIHTCTVPWRTLSPSDLDWQILNVFDSMMRFCVPLFVMISGALFLDPARELSTRRLFTHNILRIVTAFLFWSVSYAGLSFVLNFLRGMPYTPQAVGELIRNIAVGHYHLWFLFAIVGLYLITPLLRLIAANKRLAEYFLLLSFALSMMYRLLARIPALSMTLFDIHSNMQLTFVGGYPFYFILGDYLHRHGVSDRLRHILYALGGLSVIGTAVGTAIWSVQMKTPIDSLYDYLLPTTALTAAAVFLFAKHHFTTVGERTQGFIARLSSLTFGIYLCHDLFNILLNKVGISAVSITPLLGVPLISVAVFIAAAGLAWCISKLPFSRHIM